METTKPILSIIP